MTACPAIFAVVLRQGGREIRGQTADLSEGGMLVRGADGEKLSIGTSVEADLSGIGRGRARIVGRSSLGLHVEFTALEAARRERAARAARRDPGGKPGIRRSRGRCGRDGLDGVRGSGRATAS